MRNYLYMLPEAKYPRDAYARPHSNYPEYPFPELGYAQEDNPVYGMVRNLFVNLGLDEKNIGTPQWNPLGEYICQGNTVLLKPNLVKHDNKAVKEREGLECMTTHPSFIRCILDYVLIALKGEGTVIVADAPVQGCDFSALMEKGGYRKVEEFYQKAGIRICFEDLRAHTCIQDGGGVSGRDQKPAYEGKEINVGEGSYFCWSDKDDQKREKKLRITNYDYHQLQKHHHGKTHQYLISEAALGADVIINLPKPKCHRKAGYTGALKNFVGVNTSKEYLPHHTKGSREGGGGDEFLTHDWYRRLESAYKDHRDIADARGKKLTGRLLEFSFKVARRIWGAKSQEPYREGSWWGNDTVWRMVLDINYLILHADKDGRLAKEPVRRVLNIGDMIICGEKEGPMEPSPKKVGAVLFTDNAVLFDLILVKLMGFRKEALPVLKNASLDKRIFDEDEKQLFVNSNDARYNRRLQEITDSFHFCPSEGWKGAIEEE